MDRSTAARLVLGPSKHRLQGNDVFCKDSLVEGIAVLDVKVLGSQDSLQM